MTQSKDNVVKKSAVSCLAAITELSDVHQDMRRKDLMEALIRTISAEEVFEIQDEAAFAIANLAKDFSNKADIRKSGGIKALVKLLESQDPDVKKNSALALSFLLDDFSNRTEIRYVGGIAPLLDLISSDYQEVQENALQSLILCAEDFGNRAEIRKVGGIRRFLDLLMLDKPDNHQLALQCLFNCLEEVESANVLADSNGMAILFRLVQSDEPKIKRFASFCVSRAAKAERNQVAAREAGILQALVTNISSSDASVISSSAQALGNLSKNNGKLKSPRQLLYRISCLYNCYTRCQPNRIV